MKCFPELYAHCSWIIIELSIIIMNINIIMYYGCTCIKSLYISTFGQFCYVFLAYFFKIW